MNLLIYGKMKSYEVSIFMEKIKNRNYEIFRCEISFYNKFVKILHEILDKL